MPSVFVKNLSKESGKSEKEIEKLWNKAKEITSETFSKKEKDFGDKEYKYTVGIVKNMLGMEESRFDPSMFLESEKSAKQFIETLVSGTFDIGNVLPPDEEEDEIEEEEETFLDELKGDGTGPHGKGRGPGKGKADGSGLN
jgi:hypothetical protein